jgi:cysteine-rich repeat protein
MSSHTNIWILILSSQIVLISCERNAGNLLSKDVFTSSPSFETLGGPPVRRPVYGSAAKRQPLNDPAEQPMTHPPLGNMGSNPYLGGGGVDGFGPGGAPFGGPLGPGGPPPATDDDIFGGVGYDFLPEDDGYRPGLCGNGRVDQFEQCDDGNLINGDGCNIICNFELCGNGFLDIGEECDDGKNTATAPGGCGPRCIYVLCGNKVLEGQEQCDDGNYINGDGCSSQCQYEICGNAHLDPFIIINGEKLPNEQCDPGNRQAISGCNACCQFTVPVPIIP